MSPFLFARRKVTQRMHPGEYPSRHAWSSSVHFGNSPQRIVDVGSNSPKCLPLVSRSPAWIFAWGLADKANRMRCLTPGWAARPRRLCASMSFTRTIVIATNPEIPDPEMLFFQKNSLSYCCAYCNICPGFISRPGRANQGGSRWIPRNSCSCCPMGSQISRK